MIPSETSMMNLLKTKRNRLPRTSQWKNPRSRSLTALQLRQTILSRRRVQLQKHLKEWAHLWRHLLQRKQVLMGKRRHNSQNHASQGKGSIEDIDSKWAIISSLTNSRCFREESHIPEIYNYDFDNNEKPWEKNGKQDMDKYFNYGFNEETWRHHARDAQLLAKTLPHLKDIGPSSIRA